MRPVLTLRPTRQSTRVAVRPPAVVKFPDPPFPAILPSGAGPAASSGEEVPPGLTRALSPFPAMKTAPPFPAMKTAPPFPAMKTAPPFPARKHFRGPPGAIVGTGERIRRGHRGDHGDGQDHLPPAAVVLKAHGGDLQGKPAGPPRTKPRRPRPVPGGGKPPARLVDRHVAGLAVGAVAGISILTRWPSSRVLKLSRPQR